VGRNSKRAMLVSGRINCAVQFCTALPCQAVPILPGRYANFCMQLAQGPANTDLLEFAHLGVRSLNQPAPACRNWAFASLQTRLPTTGVRFQFCKFALRPARLGFTPCTAVQIYCNFCLVSPKVHFYLGNPLFATMIRRSLMQIFIFRHFQTFFIAKLFFLFLILVIFG
jgi:hypothetical protein